MIRITIQTGVHTYRISNQSHEHDGYPWRGRLLNVPELELLGKVTDQENPVREIPLAIDNHDGFIDIDTDSIWNATVTYENDNYADTWVGILARYSESGEKTLSIQATEQTQALFKLMIPDEIVRIANYTDAPRDAANTTIPMIFGGTASSPVRTKAILVDRVNFRYIICLGEIRQIVSVLKNRTAITEGFTSYTGTAGQSTYPGFAYIEFASDPRDDAGVWPEILVDVVGLKLGAHTEEECRNPARILYYLLTTARTGACGWGLGRNVSELDAASFATAISDCDSAGFKIDGAMDEQKYAPQWIDRITSACRGAFGQKAGKWALSIDKVSASVKHYGTGYAKMRVSTRGKGSMTNRKNQFVLNYRYDATDGRFLGFAQRDDVTSQNALGTTNKFEDTNKLVSDHTAAGYIVDYYKRYEEYGEDRIEFTTPDFSGVSKNSVIEITRPDFGYSAKKFRVVSISIGKRTAKIEARSYDDAIFDNDTPGTPPADPETDPTIPAAAPPNPPGVPADLSIQTNVRVQPDGTVIGYADISFTPAVAALFTRIEVGEGVAPESWVELGVIGESGVYHHEPAKVGQNYTYRLTSVNAGGSSSPVTANVTIAADTTAPLVPQAPVLSTFFKSVKVLCKQNLTLAPDHQRFDVYRNTTDDSGTATKIGEIPCGGNVSEVAYLDEDTEFGETYYYWLKSADTSNNISGFSAGAGPVTTQQIISGDIAAGALASSELFACGVVDAAAIAECAVTAAKTCIAAISRATGCLNAGVVGTTQIVDCAVATAKMAAGAVTCPKIAAGAVYACHISASAVTADAIAAGAVCAGKLAASSIYGCNIIAGTICSAQIGACQIAACNLAAGIITSEKIISTGITGACICAGTIATSKLLVAAPGMALNPDPQFMDCSAWRAASTCPWGCWTFTQIADGKVGCYVARSATGTRSTIQSLVCTPVDTTKTYRSRFWLRASAGCASSGTYGGARFMDASGTDIGAAAYVNISPLPTTWTEYSVLFGACTSKAITAGTVYISPYAWVNDCNCAGLCVEIQDLRLEEVLPATLIQDGAITTSKIIATGICGACICAGSITATQLATNSVTADKIDVGDLCAIGATIGGLTIGNSYLCATTGTGLFYVNVACGAVYTCSGCCLHGESVLGRMFWCGGYQNAYGLSVTAQGGCGLYAGIGTTIGTITLADSTSMAAGCPFMWVGDSSAYMKYYGGVLTVQGTVCATAGKIGPWSVTSDYLRYSTSEADIYLYASAGFPSVFTYSKGTVGSYAMHGKMFWSGAWKNSYGYSVTATTSGPLVAGMGVATCGSVTLPDSSTVAQCCPFFWVGDSSAYMKYYGGVLTVKGTVCATAGYISNFCITTDGLNSHACCNASYVSMRTVASGYSGYSLGYIFVGGNLGKTNCFGYGSSCVAIQGGLNGCDYFNATLQVLLGCGSACVAFYSNGCIRVSSVCCSSDRNLKYNISAVEVLPRIRSLAMSEWSFKGESVRHVGPMAQDFYEIFKGYSSDPKAIGGLDGIALKGVQELDGCVESLKICIKSLEDRLCNLETRLAAA